MIEIKESNGVKYAIGWCQYCGEPIRAEVTSSEASAKIAVRIKIDLHENQCSENPNRERSELEEYTDEILGRKKD